MKLAVITGGSRGIGAGIARVFASHGYDLVLGYRQERERAEVLAQELRHYGGNIWPLAVDVSEESSVLHFFQEIEGLGPFQVLVNSAGLSTYHLLQDVTLAEWEKLFAVNVRGTFLTCRTALRYFLLRQEGCIINMSSIWGNVGAAMEVPYSATKGAINAFTKALAKEVAFSRIRVNAIAPGPVETEMLAQLAPEDYALMLEDLPFGQLIQPADIGELAYYLAERAPQMTGQILTLDGGFIG